MKKHETDRRTLALLDTHDADIMAHFLDFLEERRRRKLAQRHCKSVQLPGDGRVSVKGIL